MVLFSDRFLLAVPIDDPLPERAKISRRRRCTRAGAAGKRPLSARSGADLLRRARPRPRQAGVTSLTIVLQMVANGYGVTLLPEVAVDVEMRDERVKLLRFVEPQPGRSIGLAWRSTFPERPISWSLARSCSGPEVQPGQKSNSFSAEPSRTS